MHNLVVEGMGAAHRRRSFAFPGSVTIFGKHLYDSGHALSRSIMTLDVGSSRDELPAV